MPNYTITSLTQAIHYSSRALLVNTFYSSELYCDRELPPPPQNTFKQTVIDNLELVGIGILLFYVLSIVVVYKYYKRRNRIFEHA
jgi:hypothetical protein